jgi:hypothetical protein
LFSRTPFPALLCGPLALVSLLPLFALPGTAFHSSALGKTLLSSFPQVFHHSQECGHHRVVFMLLIHHWDDPLYMIILPEIIKPSVWVTSGHCSLCYCHISCYGRTICHICLPNYTAYSVRTSMSFNLYISPFMLS